MSLNSSTYIRILSKGLEANLPGIEDGKLRFTTDTGRLFLDSGENRVEISDFVKGKTAQEIIQTEHPLPKFYLASDTNILYYFNNNTDQWNTVKVDIDLATTASEGLMPALEDDTSKFLRSDGTWAEAGNVKLEELEREDYDELSEDEKNNGTLFMVKNKVPDVTDFPALIGEYYKIDNSKLNPNFDWGGIKFFFNSNDCSYCYGKYKNRGYDPNAGMHPYYDHGTSNDTRNVLITQNMPTDTHYVGVYHSIYGLQCTSIIFIPKDIIDNGQAAMFLQFFYTSVECTIQYCHIWNDWTDESKYVLQSATLQPGSHPLDWSEGSIIDSGNLTLSWFANYPIIGGAYIGGEGLTQEEIDTYLATKEDNYPRYFNVNYFTYDHIFKEYDGTVMLNSIDYTGRIDTSKYALKSELSGYASTADLAGKQDVLTAGSNITFNGSTISANNTTYDLATTSSIGLIPALNGSTVKYLRSDGTWEIPAGGGGGGSIVSITPTLATGTKIADYSINGSTGELYAPNSGGSGSESSGYVTTLLYDSGSNTSGAPTNTDINLLDNLSNYDMGLIIVSTPTDRSEIQYQSSGQIIFDTKYVLINDNYHKLHWAGYGNRWIQIKFTDTTFNVDKCGGEDSGHTPVIYKIYGIKFGNGSSGKSAEVIPIEAGDNTTSRTFTFENTPKFIKVYYQDTTLDGGWALDSEIVWGQEYVNYKAHNMTVSVTGLTGGLSSISYGSDGKSMTITSGNAFGSYNSTNGSGFMFVDYGTGGESPYIETILWSGSETPIGSTTYVANLNDSIQNYDMLEIEGINDDGYYMNTILPVSYINFGQDYIESCSANSGFFYSPTSNVKITLGTYASAHPTTYTTIKGIKFGANNNSESISEYTETDLFVNPNSSNPASISLSDSIQNYDELAFIVTRNAYGNTYKLQYRYITSTLAVNDQIQVWCWGPNNEYISYVLTDWDELGSMAQGNALLLTKIVGIKHGDKNKLAPLIYSEEEREVGVWIDNKPLYQKTYVKNNIILTDNNWTNGVLGTSGIYITDFKAYFGLENTSNSNFPYSYYRNNSEFFTSVIDTSHEDINVRPNMNAGVNVTAGTITIWYTKNSDVPGSGSYNTFGELMHHYSTEEKVVGTWVDGNTLYEKSYTNFSSLTGQSRTLDFQLSGIDKIWYVSDGCLISNGTYPFPYIHYDPVNAVGGFWDLSIAGSPKFEFRTGSQSTSAVINVFTIRYTKTTS